MYSNFWRKYLLTTTIDLIVLRHSPSRVLDLHLRVTSSTCALTKIALNHPSPRCLTKSLSSSMSAGNTSFTLIPITSFHLQTSNATQTLSTKAMPHCEVFGALLIVLYDPRAAHPITSARCTTATNISMVSSIRP